ncbi:MAG: preprotein translocase subunit SecE [Bacteroidota bacterium]
MKNLITFIRESFQELRYNVTWPKYAELQNSSVLVLVASIIFALVIGLIDFGFDNIMRLFYDSVTTSN